MSLYLLSLLGYIPVDPQICQERIENLAQKYEELKDLARNRRDKLDESLRLWRFFWELADDETWIKEQAQIVSSTDIGHDLTSVNLLLNKHKVSDCKENVSFLNLLHCE